MVRGKSLLSLTAAGFAILSLGISGCAGRRGPSASQLAVESAVNKAEEASKIAQDAAVKAQQAAARAEAAARSTSQPAVETPSSSYTPAPSYGGGSRAGVDTGMANDLAVTPLPRRARRGGE